MARKTQPLGNQPDQPRKDEPEARRPQQQTKWGGNSTQDILAVAGAIPVGPQGPQPPNGEEQTRAHRVERRDRWRLGVEIGALLVGFAGIVGLLLTLRETIKAVDAARTQAETAQGQLEEMKSSSADTKAVADAAKAQAENTEKLALAADRQSRAAQAAADAAQRSAQVAEDTLTAITASSRLDQRAWVGGVVSIAYEPGNPSKKMTADSPIKFTAKVKNAGKTPAVNLKGRIAGPLLVNKGKKFPLFQEGRIRIDFTKETGSTNVLFPDMTIEYNTVPTPFSQKWLTDIVNGDFVLHVVGMLEYEDVFVPPTPHCTVFCVTLAADLETIIACPTDNYVTDTKCSEIGSKQ